jgi:hypothetical protein
VRCVHRLERHETSKTPDLHWDATKIAQFL